MCPCRTRSNHFKQGFADIKKDTEVHSLRTLFLIVKSRPNQVKICLWLLGVSLILSAVMIKDRM